MRALVAIDSTEPSRDAIEFARELLGDDDEAVVLNVSSNEPPAIAPLAMIAASPSPYMATSGAAVGSSAPTYPVIDPITGVTVLEQPAGERRTEAELAARSVAARAAEELDADEAIVEFGDPATRIVEVATEHEVDLIIVGTRDRNAVKRFFTGSVSRDVLEHAPCSVLIVR